MKAIKAEVDEKISWKPTICCQQRINFNYFSDINNIMASEKEQMRVSNPFLNPLWFWQNYLINWIEGSKANEHWLNVVWDLWFRTVGETEKSE